MVSDLDNSRFETAPVLAEEKKVVVEVIVLEKDFSSKEEVERNFLLMSIAYAANIGRRKSCRLSVAGAALQTAF